MKGKLLSPLYGPLTPFLAWILFAGIFFGLTKSLPPDTAGIDSYSILNFFQKYASYAGVVFGFIAFLEISILMGLAALFRILKNRFALPIIVIVEFSAWAYFGYHLVYVEPRYANIAKAIIAFLGEPMMFGGIIMAGLGLLWLLIVTAHSFYKS